MNKKNILLFEKYDGVRFVLERSLSKYEDDITIYSSHWKKDIKSQIKENNVDLLITELSKYNPDGFEISVYAREMEPELTIFWITVLGCDLFRDEKEKLGNIKCIEKPLEIKQIRNNVLRALEIQD
jgi:DNA-binding NtrC family response regulator